MDIMGGKIMKDRGEKEREQEMVLLNGIKQREAKEVLKENKKKMVMKRDQNDLRQFLATQVEEKKNQKVLYFLNISLSKLQQLYEIFINQT